MVLMEKTLITLIQQDIHRVGYDYLISLYYTQQKFCTFPLLCNLVMLLFYNRAGQPG